MLFAIVTCFGRLFSFKIINVVFSKISFFLNCVYSGSKTSQLKKRGKRILFHRTSTLTGLKNIEIGNYFYAGKRLRIEAIEKYDGGTYYPKVQIGNNVKIEDDCHIACINHILIENNVLIAGRVFITDHFHGSIEPSSLKLPPSRRLLFSKGPVVINDNVWIGEGVVILPNVTVGKNTIIGANSVVTKSVPGNSVIAGNPAKCIKQL